MLAYIKFAYKKMTVKERIGSRKMTNFQLHNFKIADKKTAYCIRVLIVLVS